MEFKPACFQLEITSKNLTIELPIKYLEKNDFSLEINKMKNSEIIFMRKMTS